MKLKKLLLTSTLLPIATIPTVAISCNKELKELNENQIPLPKDGNLAKSQAIKSLFSKINFNDFSSNLFPKDLEHYHQEDYYKKFAEKWYFDENFKDISDAKKIDKIEFLDPNSKFIGELKKQNLYEFFNENFEIRLRTAYRQLRIVLFLFLIPKSEAKRVNELDNIEYFNFKF
ncbi:variable surface lipoprotein, partial [Mycoplasma struthionis]